MCKSTKFVAEEKGVPSFTYSFGDGNLKRGVLCSHSSSQAMDQDTKPKMKSKRLYQVWRGNNKFFCGGRLIFGPDVASLLLSMLFITGPATAFLINIYPKATGPDNILWGIVFVVGGFLTILRNYRFFFMFVSTCTILCIYVFAFSWIELAQKESGIRKAILHDYISDFLIVYCFVAVWFVGGLTIFHTYLICTNQTTYENFRYRYDRKENVHNKGIMRNIKDIFFSKIPTSSNDFRSFVVEDGVMVSMDVIPDTVEDSVILSPKEKVDIEIGTRLAEDHEVPIPNICRTFNYDHLEYYLKHVEEEGQQWVYLSGAEQAAGESVRSSSSGDRMTDMLKVNDDDGDRAVKESSRVLDELKESKQSSSTATTANTI